MDRNFLQGVIQTFPSTLIAKLKAGEKVTVDKWERITAWNLGKDSQDRLREANDWLANGFNVGFILKHGCGFWVLDLDGDGPWPEHIHQVIETLHPPTVHTPSGGMHLYFRLPPDLVGTPNLKAHVCHPIIDGVKQTLDIKLGGRGTLVVAPGSRRHGKTYESSGAWQAPPVLDPRTLFPSLQLLHDSSNFLTDDRPLEDRIYRARAYLRSKAPVSVYKKGGAKTLMSVVTHLTRFLRLPDDVALDLLTSPPGASWNDRCMNSITGAPYPWSLDELQNALVRSSTLVSGYGKRLWEQKQKEIRRDQLLEKFIDLILRGDEPDLPLEAVPTDCLFGDIFWIIHTGTGLQITEKWLGTSLRSRGLVLMRKGKHRRMSVMVPGGIRWVFRRHHKHRKELDAMAEGNPV